MIENYKALLYALFNSDESQRNVKSVICVYDTFDSDRLVGVFSTSNECANFFGTNRRVIDCSVCKKILKQRRYKLERVNLEEVEKR